MKANEIENAPELQQVRWACYQYWQGEELLPPHKRVIWYKWVLGPYKDRFGTKFHQSKLRLLAKLGFLKQDDALRSGHRRYYKIVDPNRVDDLLRKWDLN
jgi:hypothetical protein